MKKSIVRRVFTWLLSILVASLALQLLIQVFLVDDIYHLVKEIQGDQAFEAVIEEGRHYNEMTYKLYEDEGMPLLVLDQDRQIVNMSFFQQLSYLEVTTAQGDYRVLVGDFVDERGVLLEDYKHLVKGSPVVLQGYLIKGTRVVTLDNLSPNPLVGDPIRLKGTITMTHYIKRQDGVRSYQAEKLLREVGHIIESDDIRPGASSFLETETGLMLHMMVKEDGDKFLFTLNTLEDFSRTQDVFGPYYIVSFLVQVLLLVLVAFLFSRWLTRPLKTISREAKAIAGLNFSYKNRINSGDELEDLSLSLESIAGNLKDHTDHLKEEAKLKAENEERMRELLANLSHEYKTPLGIISGFVQMIEAGGNSPDHYKTIYDEIDKLNDLTKETLLLCESESYGLISQMDSVESDQVVDLSSFNTMIREKDLRVHQDLGRVNVLCDPIKINRVMANLVSNAIKYSPPRASLDLWTEVGDSHVRFFIKNTGVQIPKEDLDRIWHKYYRVDKSRHKDFGGNGIGLALVKNILDSHQATYGVYNQDGGVVFYFDLKKA